VSEAEPGAGEPRRVPDRATYLRAWSKLHGGYDPESSVLVGGWLSLTYAAARPLALLRVPPNGVTAAGLLAACGAALLARCAPDWLVAAALLVVACGLLDGLDGAVAVLTGRTTDVGYVLDSVVDRCTDLLFLLTLYWVGAPAGVCVAAGAVVMLQEYLRARAGAAGLTDVGVVTVWERPTRVIVTAAFLLGAAIYRGWSPSAADVWMRWAAWVWLGAGLVGFVQLAVVVRRRLR
jgi:phosphatidylglycerophosphate synthase